MVKEKKVKGVNNNINNNTWLNVKGEARKERENKERKGEGWREGEREIK